ncbi:MAG: hypothetical protein IJ124_12090 [Clostridia bacterium]|nr:hypothetical protein [Clostridia bacterium]
MRKLTALLAIIFTLLLGFAAWFYFGGTLRAQVYIQSAAASEYPEAYGAIRSLLASNSAPQRFDGSPLHEDAAGYTLVNVTITLTNRGLFAAEWLDIRAGAVPGDIAVYALTGEGSDIAPRDSGQVNLKLITTASPAAERPITIQYYVHGMKREITVI